MSTYDPATDPVHGSGWNNAARWGGWSWHEPRYGDFFRTCSFCGCINPDDLAAVPAGSGCGYPLCPEPRNELAQIHFPAPGEDGREREFAEGLAHRYVDTGWRASWADRKYGWPHKFYVEGLKPRDPSLLHCIGRSNGQDHPGGGAWVHASRLTRKQKQVIKDDGWGEVERDGCWYLLEPRVTLHAKFYTIHLADPAIGQEVKDAIQAASGLRFTFTDDGKVGWQRWAAALWASRGTGAEGQDSSRLARFSVRPATASDFERLVRMLFAPVAICLLVPAHLLTGAVEAAGYGFLRRAFVALAEDGQAEPGAGAEAKL